MEKRVVCKICIVVLSFVFLAVSLAGCLTPVPISSDTSTTAQETSENSDASDTSDMTTEDSTAEVSSTETSAAEAATEGVTISSANFPDAVFRNYVSSHCDTDGNGVLSAEEIAAVQTIDLAKQEISNLKGVEFFTSLIALDCSENRLLTLDVSKNMALETLNCSLNKLTTLDMSANTALTSLKCSANSLITLDVSANTALTSLNCSSNSLTGLDVSKNTALEELDCSVNSLTALDLSTNTALECLYCFRNKLSVLEIGACPNLVDAYTGGTKTEETYDDTTRWNYVNGYYYLVISPDTTIWIEGLAGWQQIAGTWYFYEDGKAVTGWKTIGTNTYYFKENGAMAASEWCDGYWLNSDGTWTYQYKATWRQNAEGWWYGDESGWYAKNETIRIDGEDYTFDENGYRK